MADLSPVTSWTADDVLHFARRAGFGVSPETAATLAAQSPATVIGAWIDGAGADVTLYDDVLGNRADPVTEPAHTASTTVAGAVDVPAVPAPHRYLVDGADAWRNDLSRAQASLAFRMQHSPWSFGERLALFFHNLFATGWHKVNSVSLMLRQWATLRDHGLDRFDDLLVRVSQDPAMCVWLDSVLNVASGSSVPNENYAREVMELYSLGVDNGYDQTDITQLARALSGWSFTVPAAAVIANPASPNQHQAADANFRVYHGGSNPDGHLWNFTAKATLPDLHATGTITFLGGTFDVGAPPTGMVPGEDALRSIVSARATQCAGFIATRLVRHFVTAGAGDADLHDVAAMLQGNGFDLRVSLKTLLGSAWFFAPEHRYALVEGPVSWIVRAARALCPALAAADAAAPRAFPAWALVTPYLDLCGMKLLDSTGPNGWKEHLSWLNSNTLRFRTRVAAALALGERASFGGTTYTLFPTSVDDWFPTPPAQPSDVLDRLVALLQPAPLDASLTTGWLASLWPSTFTWNDDGKRRARELALLVLSSPAGQLY